jgi:hypothetical protein
VSGARADNAHELIGQTAELTDRRLNAMSVADQILRIMDTRITVWDPVNLERCAEPRTQRVGNLSRARSASGI